MKFKKILIIFLCVALLAAFSVSCFATSQESYGFYISPGEYVFDDFLTPSVFDFELSFTFIYGDVGYIGYGISSNPTAFNLLYDPGFTSGFSVYFYESGTFVSSFNRHITVLEGFYIYDINIYQWWQSNVTRVSPGYNSSFFDSILSIFTVIGQFISGAVANLTSMFFVDNSLTFVGTLTIAALAMAVVFLIIGFISRFLRFKA